MSVTCNNLGCYYEKVCRTSLEDSGSGGKAPRCAELPTQGTEDRGAPQRFQKNSTPFQIQCKECMK